MKAFWPQLSPARKAGLAAGAAAIVAMTAGLGYWSLRNDYVAVVSNASTERLAVSVREIEKLKIPYRISADGTSLEVPADQAGRVRMGVASGHTGGPSVGFEIFNSTDFSTTEFTQKINYQRALQGELSRTIAGMEGISGARVHLVLPESGYLRRDAVHPTAAVTVAMQPGMALGAQQVKGIQQLVAASVPDIQLKDIAVLDQAGEVLTRNSTGTDSEPASKQLQLKREVDAYLEAKLRNLLSNMDPHGEFSVSVDASLSRDDVKVTTEDVLPSDQGKGNRGGGVLVKERQSQRQESQGAAEAGNAASGPTSGSVTKEAEYRVGRRVEQVATVPGNIERISVAVVARVSQRGADEPRVRSLVFHAIGADTERGDSVAVIFLPPSASESTENQSAPSATGAKAAGPGQLVEPHAGPSKLFVGAMALLVVSVLLAVAYAVVGRTSGAKLAPAGKEPTDKELEDIVEQVRAWLSEEGKPHAA